MAQPIHFLFVWVLCSNPSYVHGLAHPQLYISKPKTPIFFLLSENIGIQFKKKKRNICIPHRISIFFTTLALLSRNIMHHYYVKSDIQCVTRFDFLKHVKLDLIPKFMCIKKYYLKRFSIMHLAVF